MPQLTFKSTNDHNTYRNKDAEELLDKIVVYDEDFDYVDPNDPSEWEYTFNYGGFTVADMLRSLPKGVRWNPRTDSFEGW